ncbi:MAG: NAD(P)/FAD-dependent oxidoreductase [Micrococcaceae bacterium]
MATQDEQVQSIKSEETDQVNAGEKHRTLIVGGGYVGLYTALRLQKRISDANHVITVVDPYPYMTYQPFLPEVAAGSIEPRDAVVSHRRHLRGCELINAKVTNISHADRKVTLEAKDGNAYELPYDEIVVAAGANTKTFPIDGLAEHGIGMKTIEEATAVRNNVLERIETASTMTNPEDKKAALTFVVVGGGFAGIETIAELEDMARVAVSRNKYLTIKDIRFVMVEAAGRIMPEVTEDQAEKVVKQLEARGIDVFLNTSLASVTDNNTINLMNMEDKSPGESFKADTLIWTAGVAASPVAKNSDLPTDDRGRITCGADLRVKDADGNVVPHAWAAGDISAVPDLTGGGLPDGTCVPNAQHAVRQAKVLARNIAASYSNGSLQEYKHENMGAVAGLGMYKGVAKMPMGIKLTGFPAWFMHRAYHGAAMPMFERKFRVASGWFWNWAAGRDTTQLINLEDPRQAFVEAATPAPKPAEPKAVEATTETVLPDDAVKVATTQTITTEHHTL